MKSEYLIGAAAGIFLLFNKKSTRSIIKPAISSYKNSYYFDCTSFKIIDQEKFTKFNELLIEKVFKGLGGTSKNLLEFQNYVIGFGQKYMRQISDLQEISCKLEIQEVKIVYFILVRDALVNLKKFGQQTLEWNEMFDTVIGGYVDIWMQYLKIPKEDGILQIIADRFKVYRETGVL